MLPIDTRKTSTALLLCVGKAVIRIYLVLWLALSTSTTNNPTAAVSSFNQKNLWAVLLIPTQYRQPLFNTAPRLPGSCLYPRSAIPPTSIAESLNNDELNLSVHYSSSCRPPEHLQFLHITTYTIFSAGQCHCDKLVALRTADPSTDPLDVVPTRPPSLADLLAQFLRVETPVTATSNRRNIDRYLVQIHVTKQQSQLYENYLILRSVFRIQTCTSESIH